MADRNSIVQSNLGLVHLCAKKFRNKGIEYDDLYQAGCVGLVKAVDSFDPGRGYKLSTYAVPVIMGEIKRLFRDGGSIKVSRELRDLSLKIAKQRECFIKKNCREPTVKELSVTMGVTPEKITEAIAGTGHPLSLTCDSDNEEQQLDIPVDDCSESITDIISVRSEIKKLNQFEAALIKYRYYYELTQSQTAQKLGTTQVQISRKEKQILIRLRRSFM